MRRFVKYGLLLALAVSLALPTMARADLSSAKKNALSMADTFERLGYTIRDPRKYGDMAKGQYYTFSTTLFQGSTYVFVAAGDGRAKNVNLKIWDENGNLIANDDDLSGVAVAKVTPVWSGNFYVRVVMADCDPGSASWYLLTGQAIEPQLPVPPPMPPKEVEYFKYKLGRPQSQSEIEAYFKPYLARPDTIVLDRFGRTVYSALAVVYFDFDKATIRSESYPILNEWGRALQGQLRRAVFMVEGHTDSVGDPAYNRKLSQQRADAVRQYLIGNFNISPARLVAKGFGSQFPIASNKNAAGRAENRRVQFTLIDWLP